MCSSHDPCPLFRFGSYTKVTKLTVLDEACSKFQQIIFFNNKNEKLGRNRPHTQDLEYVKLMLYTLDQIF